MKRAIKAISRKAMSFFLGSDHRRVWKKMTIVDTASEEKHYLLFEEGNVPCDLCILRYISEAYNIPKKRLTIHSVQRCYRLRGGGVEEIESS